MSLRARDGLSGVLSREIDLDFRPLVRWIKENPSKILIGIGIFLRIWEYLGNRSYWLDEGSLLGNLVNHSIFDFSQTLSGDQLAPFGFIIVERCVHRILDYKTYTMRLFPLISGIVALFLFSKLSKRALAPRSALIALALFSLSSDLIYYSAELKQYSTDLAIAIFLTLNVRDLLESPLTLRSGSGLLVLAIASPWISFTSSFVIAGAGITLLGHRLLRRQYGEARWVALIGAMWTISFALCYRATHALLSPYTTMYVFWDFAFLPFPPRDIEGILKFGGILLDVFVNPLNMVAPIWPAIGVIVPIVFLLLGVKSYGKRNPELLSLIALPLLLAIIASGMRRYPLHGRLMLELVPAFFLLIAEGTEWVRLSNPGRPWVYRTTLIALLAYPLMSGFLDGLSRSPRTFDLHGDLRHNLFLHEHLKNVVPIRPESDIR